MIKDDKTLVTKYGNAKISDIEYYRITSIKEGNYGKLLHRLIYEEHYGEIPEGYHIHHINGNKLDNRIENLECIEKSKHHSLHCKGKNNPFYDKKHTKESRIKMSKKQNTTGIMYVSIDKNDRCKQGFLYRYRYFDKNGRMISIRRVNLDDLEKEVKRRGLPWIVLGDMI